MEKTNGQILAEKIDQYTELVEQLDTQIATLKNEITAYEVTVANLRSQIEEYELTLEN